MQINFAKRWILSHVGVWGLDPALRTTFLEALAAAVGAPHANGVVTLQPPGRWFVGQRINTCEGGPGDAVEVPDPDGPMTLDGMQLNVEFTACGPDAPPTALLDAYVLVAAEDPLPSLAKLSRCARDQGQDLKRSLSAFQLQTRAVFPDLPHVPRCVGSDPLPAVKVAAQALVAGLLKEYCSCVLQPMGQTQRELRLGAMAPVAVSARDSRPRERS